MRHIHIVTTEPAYGSKASAPVQAGCTAGEHLIIEDGWVFREHHGKYVECICRIDEMPHLARAAGTRAEH